MVTKKTTSKVTGKKAVKKTSTKKTTKKKPEGYKLGRPTKYDPKYCNMLIDYFKDAPLFEIDIQTYMDKNGNEHTKEIKRPAPQPSIIRFAASIGVDDTTIYEWQKHPEFSRAKKTAKKFQEIWLNEAAGAFGYNPAIAIIQLKHNHGYRDTSVVESKNTNLNVETQASKKPITKMNDEEKAKVQEELSKFGFTTSNDFLKGKEVDDE